nr:hypothetical protein [Tanacetum cinerariifolium]
ALRQQPSIARRCAGPFCLQIRVVACWLAPALQLRLASGGRGRGGAIAEKATFLFHYFHNAVVEFFLCVEVFVVAGGFHEVLHGYFLAVGGQGIKLYLHILRHQPMRFDGFYCARNNGVELGTGRFLVEEQREAHPPRSAEAQVVQRLVNHAFIRHGKKAFLGRAQAGAAKPDFLDRAAHVARRHEVAHAKWLVEEDGKRGQQVFQAFLGCKGYRQPPNAQRAHKAHHIHPKHLAQHHEHPQNDDEYLEQILGK